MKITKKIMCSVKVHLFSLYLMSAITVFTGGIMLAAKPTNETPAKERKMQNVRVLRDFSEWYYSTLPNCGDMYRPNSVIAQAIVEHITKENMPPIPLPALRSVEDSEDDVKNTPAPPKMYYMYPIAWSIKTINIERAFLPQLSEEVIVLVHFSPQYFKEGAFADGTWILAYLCNQSNPLVPHNIGGDDSTSVWTIGVLPEFTSPEKRPQSSGIRDKPNIACFVNKPTMEQVSEFVKSTNFGNNDVFAHTSLSKKVEVDVVQVVVYPQYSGLKGLFQRGVSSQILEKRKVVYGEAFRRSTITPYIDPGRLLPE